MKVSKSYEKENLLITLLTVLTVLTALGSVDSLSVQKSNSLCNYSNGRTNQIGCLTYRGYQKKSCKRHMHLMAEPHYKSHLRHLHRLNHC